MNNVLPTNQPFYIPSQVISLREILYLSFSAINIVHGRKFQRSSEWLEMVLLALSPGYVFIISW